VLADLLKMLDGKKSYLAGVCLLIGAFVQFQAKNYPEAWHLLAEALAVFGLRHAVAKQEPPKSPPAPPPAQP
jgi:hypothetical protein